MALKSWHVLFAGLCLASACGDESSPEDSESNESTNTNSQSDGDGGGSPVSPSTPAGEDAGLVGPAVSPPPAPMQPVEKPATQAPYDYEMKEVALTSDLVIPAGQTVRVGPGVKFVAKGKYKIQVLGTFIVEGTTAAPSTFAGSGSQESWHGIVVENGGQLFLENAQVSEARYGVHALPGSSYAIERTTFDTSFKGAVLESGGTLSYATFNAVLLFPQVTEGVSIDDPNGFLTIINASPKVTNSLFNGSGGFNDMVRVGGNASPVFDHCNVNNSHCGFHTSGGTNTSMRITNTVFDGLAYGIMAFATKPIIESSVFRRNSNDVGFCNGATEANTPVLKGNFYEKGALLLDPGCAKIATKDSAPATKANASAGPIGL